MAKKDVERERDLEAAQEELEDLEAARTLGSVAVFKVRYADKMNEEDKLAIAEWLRHQAEMLLSDGHLYGPIYTARYNPEDEPR